ncbi:MAG TPA: sulfurtransferase [Kofleriaceae bacterium]
MLPPLVEVDWLVSQLGQPDLRILDPTIQILPTGIRTGQSDWERAHIPGSIFVDLIKLSDPAAPPHTLTMPPAAWFAAEMGRLGVGDGARVVIYDARENMWAARLWWMFRSFGIDDVAILNGGWTMWQRAQAPVCHDPCSYAPAALTVRLRPELVVGKQQVLAAIDDPDTCLVNALGRRQHHGEISEYGRPGHIPGSVNVTAWEILERETQRYKSVEQLRQRFAAVLGARRIITYCGSGIACSSDAFALHLLGHDNVSIYDGSLLEWCADPSLPLTVGP